MIIVKLMGGLGNQMFQYAAARRLAHHHNTALKLDLSFLEQTKELTTRRDFELKHFAIHATVAAPLELSGINGRTNNILKSALIGIRRLVKLAPAHPNVYEERHFHFDPQVLKAPDNTYLDGYWQTEKYFEEISDIIRNEFKVTSEPDELNKERAEEIKETESVSIHVRRGDYISDSATNEYHGVCPIPYYQRAVDMMANRLSSPKFFIFSDDPHWAREHLKLPYPMRLLDHNGPQRGYEDLRLMSLCRHHITANSSFSWWGAWLCRNRDQIVIAPRRWFNNEEINTNDLLPRNWLTISM